MALPKPENIAVGQRWKWNNIPECSYVCQIIKEPKNTYSYDIVIKIEEVIFVSSGTPTWVQVGRTQTSFSQQTFLEISGWEYLGCDGEAKNPVPNGTHCSKCNYFNEYINSKDYICFNCR